MTRYSTALVAALAAACVGCAGNGEGLDENGRPIGGEPQPLVATFDSIQQNVFTPMCTGCHAGAQAPQGLRLDADSSYAMLVNTPSNEVPGLRRVQPGNPSASYLIHKLEGTAAVGARMPLNGPALPQATIDVIRQWIIEGAQRPAPGGSGPTVLRAIAPASDDILDAPPHEVVIEASAELDLSRLSTGHILLLRSGCDGSFAEGNEVAVPVLHVEVRSVQPTVLALTLPGGGWIADSYRLTLPDDGAAPMADLAANVIDGDADGVPGGDFVLYFELGGTP